MLGQLVPCGGGKPIPLLHPKLLVGRQSPCEIVLGFATVSSRHCELEFRNGYWHVRDLASKNGTRVNGAVCESRRLLPNDILAVAGYRYLVAYTAPPEASPPENAAPAPAVPATGGVSADAAEKAPARPTPEIPSGSSPYGQLVPCGGGDPIPLRQLKLVVGRHDTCDVVLPLNTISGRHCQLEWTERGWLVRDLGSRNGVRVDGVRCEEKLLAPGSILALAGQRYQVVYTTQGAGPGPGARSLFAQSLLEAAGLVHWRAAQDPGGQRKRSEEDLRQRWTLEDAT